MTFKQRLRYVAKLYTAMADEYDEFTPLIVFLQLLTFVIFAADIFHSIFTLTMPGLFTAIYFPIFLGLTAIVYMIILANDYDIEVREEMFPEDEPQTVSP